LEARPNILKARTTYIFASKPPMVDMYNTINEVKTMIGKANYNEVGIIIGFTKNFINKYVIASVNG
jgi:hypothetical protein